MLTYFVHLPLAYYSNSLLWNMELLITAMGNGDSKTKPEIIEQKFRKPFEPLGPTIDWQDATYKK